MAKDTVERIREAELEAREIIEKAQEQAKLREQEAHEKASQLLEKSVAAAQLAADDALAASKAAGEKLQQENRVQYEKQCAQLRSAAAGKKREAIEAVVKMLTDSVSGGNG